MTHTALCPMLLRRIALYGLGMGLAALLLAPDAFASDHADPVRLNRLEAGITDLFVFPTKEGMPTLEQGDHFVVILCVRRLLAKAPPYQGLDQFTYTIFMDLDSEVRFTNEADRKRYGGTVTKPEAISEDVVITLRLDENGRLPGDKGTVTGLKKEDSIRWWSGIRDDPFIFPQFFGTNVIAVVISIPFDCFPDGQKDWLIWATSARHGVQVDHVGRSQRTQLPRFDFLNSLHPKDHVAAIAKKREAPGLVDDLLRTNIPPEFAIRPYDLHPDLMIFTRRPDYPPTFPNGRQLIDDVAKLTCAQGDCQLFELSFAHPRSARYEGGRPAKNDRDFLTTFPYLAEPWPNPEPPPPPALTARSQILLGILILVAAGIVLLPWVLYFRALRRLRTVVRQPVPAG